MLYCYSIYTIFYILFIHFIAILLRQNDYTLIYNAYIRRIVGIDYKFITIPLSIEKNI